jgi:hypothetical protein
MLMMKAPNRTSNPCSHYTTARWLSIRVTQIELAKKANPYKRNREHKQEQGRMQLNLQMNV